MKLREFVLAGMLAAAFVASGQAQQPGQQPGQPAAPPALSPAEAAKNREQASYIFGIDFATNLQRYMQQYELDEASVMRGLQDQLAGMPKIKQEEFQNVMTIYFQTLAERERQKNVDYLTTNKDKPGVKVTASGLQYQVLREGNGKSPREQDSVSVHYKGALIDGTEFDSSYERNQPVEFGVTQVIKGWTEALQLMKEGEKWRLVIPANLAYGANPPPQSGIPPHATLVFEVELLKVLDRKLPPPTPQ